MTQAELAAQAKVPIGTVRNLEQGHRADPRLSTAVALAQALGISLDVLAGLREG